MSNDIDVKPLEQLLAKYEYGKHHIKPEEVEVIYNPTSDTLSVTNFYAFGKYLRTGTCVELMNTACIETKKLYPGYHVLRACGHEPKFFFQKSITHYFDILSEEKLINGMVLSDRRRIHKLLEEKNPWIVDPSLQHVIKFSESRYIVDALYNGSYPQINHNTATIVGPENLKPIGITPQNQIIYISMSPKFNETFWITIQNMNNMTERTIPIQDSRVDRVIKCEKILRTIDILRNKKKKVSVQPIESTEEIFYG